jgi:hypothetical protein
MTRALHGRSRSALRIIDRQLGHLVRGAARMAGGRCPAGCSGQLGLPTAVVYRSSARSITYRCNVCGLQWTVTIHQLAKSARRVADLTRGSEFAHADDNVATVLERWAEAVGESRGRKPTKTTKWSPRAAGTAEGVTVAPEDTDATAGQP